MDRHAFVHPAREAVNLNILETAASTRSPFLHPGGEALTQILINILALQPHQQVLEIGCGTGATAVRLAESTTANVIAFEYMPAMLAIAKIRAKQSIHAPSLLAANANVPFPFASSTFDAIYAESVLALTQVPHVFREMARLLKPNGKLVINERIWKPGVTEEEANEINALSRQFFGIPAATPKPWNKNDWSAKLAEVGFTSLQATLVDSLLPPAHHQKIRLVQRLTHLREHLKHPTTYLRSLQFRWAGRRYAKVWERLEAVLFTGIKNG